MLKASEALGRLQEGNRRFVSGIHNRAAPTSPTRRSELVSKQQPFAIILGCADSRVPPEVVFDQGLGDLFVIRVAGNVVAPSQAGSIEYAAERIGTRLVVVLGHSQCGAVAATIDELEQPQESRSSNLNAIVSLIRPAVQSLKEVTPGQDRDTLMEQAVRANVRASADHLRHGSSVLEELIRRDRLTIVGAEYSLESGEVDFFDGLP